MTFFVTFAQKYRHELHPSGLDIHPNGYWTIRAKTYKIAWRAAVEAFGRFGFSSLLSANQFDATDYPRGSLGFTDRSEETSTVHELELDDAGMRANYEDGKITIEIDISHVENFIKSLEDYKVTDSHSLGVYSADKILQLMQVDTLNSEPKAPLLNQLVETCVVEANRVGQGVRYIGEDWMDEA